MTFVEPLVRDVDENGLLQRIFARIDPGGMTILGVGDDAAVVRAPDGRFVVSTDVLVENHHFRRQWSTGYDVGWRAGVQNLADIAAMGAVPTAVVVALGLPRDLPVRWVEEFFLGLNQVCQDVGAAVVGGDLSGSPVVFASVTVHGDLQYRHPVVRSGARPGDVVAHAGNRGWSAAGLAVLSEGGEFQAGSAVARAVDLFLRPEAPVSCAVAAAESATSMMDVSDGLLRDATRIAEASSVGFVLQDPLNVWTDSTLGEVATFVGQEHSQGAAQATAQLPNLVHTWLLTGGEDHGFLATFPAGSKLPPHFMEIGRVVEQEVGQPRVHVEGVDTVGLHSGWDHFSS